MLDDYLKKESVLNVIGEIKNNPKYNGNSVSFRDSDFSSIEISLYSFYDALFKYKVIVDDDTLFGDFIEQVNKLYKKIDNFNDILLGINKLVGYMVIKHLKIKDINDPRQKKEVLDYIYDKYIVNGYYIHGISSVYESDIKRDGFVSEIYLNNYDKMLEIKKIFEKYKFFDIVEKDFSLNKVYFTDDFMMGCYYSSVGPYYFYNMLFNRIYGNKINKDCYLKNDFDSSVNYLKKFMSNNLFSDKDKNLVLNNIKVHFDYLNSVPRKVSLIIVKRNLINLQATYSDYKDLDVDDIYEAIDMILSSKNSNVGFSGTIQSNDINIVSLDNCYDNSCKNDEDDDEELVQKMDIKKENKEFLDKYGSVYIFIIIGSLLVSFGVILSLFFMIRGI